MITSQSVEDKIQSGLVEALSEGKDSCQFNVSRTNINLVQKHINYMGYEAKFEDDSDCTNSNLIRVIVSWK